MKSVKTGANIKMTAQYIKDLSFENPKAPLIYTKQDFKPEIAVTVDINATKLQETFYEVELVIKTEAKDKEDIAFILELKQGGIFEIETESNLLEEVLFVDCAYLLFPYARKKIQDITIDGNFPPLTLDLIDFDTLYKQRKEKDN